MLVGSRVLVPAFGAFFPASDTPLKIGFKNLDLGINLRPFFSTCPLMAFAALDPVKASGSATRSPIGAKNFSVGVGSVFLLLKNSSVVGPSPIIALSISRCLSFLSKTDSKGSPVKALVSWPSLLVKRAVRVTEPGKAKALCKSLGGELAVLTLGGVFAD